MALLTPPPRSSPSSHQSPTTPPQSPGWLSHRLTRRPTRRARIPRAAPRRADPAQRPPRLHHGRVQRHRARHGHGRGAGGRAGLHPGPQRRPARAAIQRDSGRDDVGAHAADVRDADAVARALREAGPVDVLVCNHGVFVPQELERQDMDEVKWMVDINLMGTFHLIKAALPAMKARTRETRLPGSIAIMSSQAGQVGIYGYTAYSASKFALRGLGEALQHEVADNIHVSLIFPPDTETPGFEEEHKRRPELSNIMAGSSGRMQANDVANKALDDIESAKFIVPCNFEGTMLAVATAGLSPQSSPLMAFIEVIGAGLMRFAALCFQWNWFSTIERYMPRT